MPNKRRDTILCKNIATSIDFCNSILYLCNIIHQNDCMKRINNCRRNDMITFAYRILRSAAARGKHLTMNELCDEVLKCRPLHYYVSFDRASRIIHSIDRGIKAGVPAQSEAAAMWNDMYAQIQELRTSRPQLTLTQAMSQTICFLRPKRFYITRDALRRILRKHFTATVIPIDNFDTRIIS